MSDACLFPPGMQKRGRWEEEKTKERLGGKKQAEDESRHRATPIKNDSRRRSRQAAERKKRDYGGRGKRQNKSSLEKWRSWEKTEESTIEAGRQGETVGQGVEERHLNNLGP